MKQPLSTLQDWHLLRLEESVIRLMLMNLWPLMPMSLKFLYSPGLMYIILPLNWGCSYISQ
ncbi:hypothetical protein F7725_002410 [Dissostichus mawsoni]|uniref:Uncharacterized protein n=1 Tax=Dissostichus mawsoni TaxID=36200 RepID=A0A7J5Y3H1_DISMA|nr:hypothetical protein F7725_002410 [Dissostichus mawsoni]